MGIYQNGYSPRRMNSSFRCPFCLRRFTSPDQVARHVVYANCGRRASRVHTRINGRYRRHW